MKLNNPNDSYGNFILKRVVKLPEINCLLKEIEHAPTGAQVLHIENDDPENVFCLSFRTLPDTANGVAHILEHTVLCGSNKYPLKDPFFAMTRRSLNTFMNAFTGDDFTCYPAASQVPRDFYNLLEVYLDAVFKPNLKKLSFLQEGHRLEFSIPDDPSSPLEYKGIVYNEMKGAMASPDRRLNVALDHALFPDLAYGVNAGGDPVVIPELSFEELKRFHQDYYHPSRCLFYFYGNLPIEHHLDFIEENALDGIEKLPPVPHLPKQKRFEKPRSIEIGYPFSTEEEAEEQSIAAMGWLTCDLLDQDTLLALNILTIVLLGTDAAPLKMTLLKSGLCKQVFAGLGDENSEVPLTITFKGCDSENMQKLETLIFTRLKEIAQEGLPMNLVESALHQLEFHRSEIGGDDYPYGLSLFMRCALLMQHGGKPESSLLIHTLCDGLRNKMRQDPQYLTDLMKEYLIDNPHFVRVTAKPDKTLMAQERAEEESKLQAISASLNDADKESLVKQAKTLETFQKEQDEIDINILPKTSLSDVPHEAKDYPISQESTGNLTVFHHSCFTNDILYADLVFPLPYIAENELPLLRMFILLLPQLGCGGRSYVENLEYIQAYTGGMSAAETLNVQAKDPALLDPYFVIEGKALKQNEEKLFTLLHEMSNSVNFDDVSRIKEVLVKHFTGIQSTLNQNSMRYAMGLANSSLGTANRISQAMGGLEYYHFLKDLIENFDARAPSLINSLQDLQRRMLSLESPHLILACDQKSYERLKANRFYGLADIATHPYTPWKNEFQIPLVTPQGRITATPVAFSCKAMRSLPYVHPDTPALNAAAKLFDNLTLHPLIREKGGAYGGGANNNPTHGTFNFYAYRDPNIVSSVEAFDLAMKIVEEGDFTDEDLEEAKLEIIQGLDNPISPGSRAYVAYSWLRNGKSLELRQKLRDRLLSLSCDQVAMAVRKHLRPQFDQGITVVFAGKALLEAENQEFKAKNLPPLPLFPL
jgi:presequence protease